MKRRLISVALLTGLILLGLSIHVAAYPYVSSDQPISDALNYLRSIQGDDGNIGGFQTSAWVVMALAAAGEDPHEWRSSPENPSIVDYLVANTGQIDVSKATDLSRFILAMTSSRVDPRDVNGVDYLTHLEDLWDGIQIGDPSLLNDDYWALMAFKSAGYTNSTVIATITSFIKLNQNPDGGWGWAVDVGSDVDDTAAAIMALIAAGEDPNSEQISSGLQYIKGMQMDNGGFNSFGSGSTNPYTDSWAISAIVASGQDPTSDSWTSTSGYTPVDDLLSFQNPDGSFEGYSGPDPYATSNAIVALLGKAYPTISGIKVYVRIEGEHSTIWSGEVFVAYSLIMDDMGEVHNIGFPTALGALDEASKRGAFQYKVQDTSFGLYVYSIADEDAQGSFGWMFKVDYVTAMVGAASFMLNETSPPDPPHNEVLWFYGNWMDPNYALEISLDKLEVAAGEEFTVNVKYFNDTSMAWIPADGAIVHADQDYVTNGQGEVAISINSEATYTIYAEKQGYIRSNKLYLKVTGATAQTNVSATIVPAIAISVSPSSIDFGALSPGEQSSPKVIIISNVGSANAKVTVTVIDDTGLFTEGLRFNGLTYGAFQTIVSGHGDSQVTLILIVPENFSQFGEIEGSITFWAEKSG